jgi:hypothetical protein
MKIVNKPWELGEMQASQSKTYFALPDFCIGEHCLVKLGPPKTKGVRDGLVASFIMTAYYDSDGNKIELVEVNETASGYSVKFPLGKRGLFATKYRGANNRYIFYNKDGKYEIPSERFTLEGAISYCESNDENGKPNVEGWAKMSELEQSLALDEYFADMYMFGMSQDLALPIEGESFTEPFVGLQTKLYRTYTPPLEGAKYGNTIISKWRKGYKNLEPSYKTHPAALAEAINEEYQVRDIKTEDFDPTALEDDDNVI